MPAQIEIQCQGMKSPAPVIQIAQAARRYPPRTVLMVKSDDFELEADVRAWVSTAKASILRVERRDKEIWIKLQLPG